jgi:hypothetical protein
MDVDVSMSIPSPSSMDLMKLIDDVNRAIAVPDMEQWTIRGWLKCRAMFHKNNCRCCNDYIAHTIHACKEQGVDLPIQADGNAVTTAWLTLMRDLESEARVRALEDYKDLTDDTASLKVELKVSQSVLASEHSRVVRWDETIRNLKDKIVALKRPQSMVSMRHIVQSSCTAGPSSCLTAPLPARAQSGLAAWISNPGLASCIDAHPEADCFDDPPGDSCPLWTHQCPQDGRTMTQTGDQTPLSGTG